MMTPEEKKARLAALKAEVAELESAIANPYHDLPDSVGDALRELEAAAEGASTDFDAARRKVAEILILTIRKDTP